MNEDNDNGFFTYSWMFLFFLIAGLVIYFVIVMPLRIIFKNSDKNPIDVIMPFSNILDARSIMSLLFYSVTVLMWAMIIGQSHQATVSKDFLIGFSFFAITATFLSIVWAWNDVREAME